MPRRFFMSDGDFEICSDTLIFYYIASSPSVQVVGEEHTTRAPGVGLIGIPTKAEAEGNLLLNFLSLVINQRKKFK